MYTCKNCGKTYSREDYYLKHIENCKEIKLETIELDEFFEEKKEEEDKCKEIKRLIEEAKNKPVERTYIKHFGKLRCSKCRKYFFSLQVFNKHICK